MDPVYTEGLGNNSLENGGILLNLKERKQEKIVCDNFYILR